MNYQKIYWLIINKRLLYPANLTDNYVEYHHIIPKSLGGSKKQSNIVCLTAREHFIVHLLLTKMFNKGTLNWIKMQKAFCLMSAQSQNQQRYHNSVWYEYQRKNISLANSLNQSGENNSQYGKCWIYNQRYQKSISIPKTNLPYYLSEGWVKGRKIKWDSPKLQGEILHKITTILNKVQQYKEWYEIYNRYGWKEFVIQTGYNKTQANLVRLFSKYVNNYKSQNGKKRGLTK